MVENKVKITRHQLIQMIREAKKEGTYNLTKNIGPEDTGPKGQNLGRIAQSIIEKMGQGASLQDTVNLLGKWMDRFEASRRLTTAEKKIIGDAIDGAFNDISQMVKKVLEL